MAAVAIMIEHLFVVLQGLLDLLGTLNPFKLLKADYRASFRAVWKQVPTVFRVGYVLGILGVIVLIAVLVLAIWSENSRLEERVKVVTQLNQASS